ncbi:hypothetical protein HPB48_022806 [Haemaphysalis longicornis]|uniref:Uncharacterized protein n=1 Tax=Haemaphysalis longicornis TaxID=44386 RepID=A0A9J6G9J0_HAELO|nr:hypothetical protein HPB48_022806 [Haemaphysalis longicornis]
MSFVLKAPSHGANSTGLRPTMRSCRRTTIACPTLCARHWKPVFTRLSETALLERCSDGLTQNPSESLHSVIWQQVSKTQHASLRSVERAVAEAVSRFNQGVTRSNAEIAEKLGYSPGGRSVLRSLEKDNIRLEKSKRKHMDSVQQKHDLQGDTNKQGTLPTVPGLL